MMHSAGIPVVTTEHYYFCSNVAITYYPLQQGLEKSSRNKIRLSAAEDPSQRELQSVVGCRDINAKESY